MIDNLLKRTENIEKFINDSKNKLYNKREGLKLFFYGLLVGIIGNMVASIIHQTFIDHLKRYYLIYVLVSISLILLIIFAIKVIFLKYTKLNVELDYGEKEVYKLKNDINNFNKK